MSKIAFFLLISGLAAMSFACSGTNTTNTNQANLPPEFSANSINTNVNAVPGIDPKNINIAPNPNGTPTPGIPDPRNVNVKPNPNGTSTPGIPSEKELKQMQSNMKSNANLNQSMTDSDKTPQTKSNKP
jgi:hypothetical protein